MCADINSSERHFHNSIADVELRWKQTSFRNKEKKYVYSHLNSEFYSYALILNCSNAVNHLTNALRRSERAMCIRLSLSSLSNKRWQSQRTIWSSISIVYFTKSMKSGVWLPASTSFLSLLVGLKVMDTIESNNTTKSNKKAIHQCKRISEHEKQTQLFDGSSDDTFGNVRKM